MKNLKFMFALVITLVAFSYNGIAQNNEVTNESEQFTVKCTSVEDDYINFEVDFINSPSKIKFLTISDKVEGELYSQSLKSKNIFKNFKVERKDDQVIIFKLQIDDKEYVKSFKLNSSIIHQPTVTENVIAKN